MAKPRHVTSPAVRQMWMLTVIGLVLTSEAAVPKTLILDSSTLTRAPTGNSRLEAMKPSPPLACAPGPVAALVVLLLPGPWQDPGHPHERRRTRRQISQHRKTVPKPVFRLANGARRSAPTTLSRKSPRAAQRRPRAEHRREHRRGRIRSPSRKQSALPGWWRTANRVTVTGGGRCPRPLWVPTAPTPWISIRLRRSTRLCLRAPISTGSATFMSSRADPSGALGTWKQQLRTYLRERLPRVSPTWPPLVQPRPHRRQQYRRGRILLPFPQEDPKIAKSSGPISPSSKRWSPFPTLPRPVSTPLPI